MGTPIALHETTPRPIGRRLETAGEIEMAMRMKRVLYLAVASCALAGALYVPARAAGLNIETATIADLNAAFAGGTLTSEQLVSAYLKRIEAYDKQGPAINAIITLNKKALDEARQLDAERKSGKVRGPLHGIPVVLKDNYDTVDMPTTAGSQLLEGHMAKQDAFMVKKLREAGAIVLAKVNLSEFAGSGGSVSGATDPAIIKAGSIPNGSSSAGGQTKNPHELLHGPAGSGGGAGGHDRRRSGRRCDEEERGEIRARLHEVLEDGRAQRRAHRDCARLHGKGCRHRRGRRGRHRHAQKARRSRHRPNQVPRLHPPIEGGAVQHRDLCRIQGTDR